MDAVLAAVWQHNDDRRISAQNWSLAVYFMVGLNMIFHTYILAGIIAWATPARLVTVLPHAEDVRFATLYWMYPLLLLNALISAGTGMTGWAVIGTVYTLAAIGTAIHGQVQVYRRQTKTGGTAGGGPLLNTDGSIAAEQEALERELLKNFIAGRSPPPNAITLRVARMMARYNPERLSRVDEMLANYAHTEERLLVDLRRKYGPEPEITVVDKRSAAAPSSSSSAVAAALLKAGRSRRTWKRVPFPMDPTQLAAVLVSLLLVLLCLTGCLLIVYVWDIDEYRIVQRSPAAPATSPGNLVATSEFQPPVTAKALQLMYSWPGFASDMRLQFYVSQLTQYCGNEFRKDLPDRGAREIIKTEWIDVYNINMSQYDPAEWWEYSSVNAWFIRELAPGARPIAHPGDDTVVVTPADARVTVFSNVSRATKLWIKGGRFSWRALMDFEAVNGEPDYFEGGTIVVARLAPQDYHRFHSPVAGRVLSMRTTGDTYWSVNADAVQSDNNVFLNRRTISVLDAGSLQGKVGFVAIGATCVGSVVMSRGAGMPLTLDMDVNRGTELGLMQFGGSTIVLLFRRGAFVPACDLAAASSNSVETYLPMGSAIGSFASDPDFTGVHERCVHL